MKIGKRAFVNPSEVMKALNHHFTIHAVEARESPEVMTRKFSPETLENLHARLPKYLSKMGVDFRKSGSRLVARCPVHEDHSPSFAMFGNPASRLVGFPCNTPRNRMP